MTRRPITAIEAKAWAEDLCSRAEYASGEIRERLIRKGLSPAVADRITGELIEARFIDDARFARAFVRDKTAFARWGKQKIIAALYQKRVGREEISEAIDEIDNDAYVDGLADLLRAKLRSLGSEADDDGSYSPDYDTRVRLFRFAASRGYESSAISRALSMLK